MTRIVITDDLTAQREADAKKYAGLRELSDLIVKRVRGEVADILLVRELRVEGMILDWVKGVEKRLLRVPRCPKCLSPKLSGPCGHVWEID